MFVVPRRRSRPILTLFSCLVLIFTITSWSGAPRALADTPSFLSVFYAVPTSDGNNIEVAGLFHGAPSTDYDDDDNPGIRFDEQDSCHDEGFTVDTIAVTTDANGDAYFTAELPADAPFIQAYLSNYSTFADCYPVGPDNTAWSTASRIPLTDGVGSGTGAIGLEGETRWYKVNATPDSTLNITLSGLTSDDDLAVFGDIGQADGDVSDGVQSLDQLSAESPSDAFSPSAFIPSAFTPSAFIPSAFTPSAFTPSAFTPSAFIPSAFTPSAFTPSQYSPSAFIPSAFIPSAFTPSAFTPSAFTPSAFTPSAFTSSGFTPSAFIPSTYSSAVSQNLLAYSDQGGSADKSLTVNTYQSAGDFYVAVAGRDGATNSDAPFTVTVNDGSGSCDPSVAEIGSAPAAAPSAGVHTVILTDSSRVPGSSADKSFMLSQLQTLAARPEVNGTVVDLADSSRVQQLDAQADANPDCPFAENLVAGAIRDVVNSYRANNPLTYVVIAGGDAVVPFFRHPDETLIGNETGYTPPLGDNTAAQAALRLGYTLSDNDYGAKTTLSLKDDSYPVPDLAVGRLVETASEISGQIQTYLGNAGGVLPTPQSSLVTGYDFLTLAANQVKSDLEAGTGSPADTLIAPRSQAPSDPASWTGTDLRNKVLNSGRHDIIFLAGHFSANDTLAADYKTDMITTDMESSSVDLANTLVFSAGCHSGYNIPDGEALPGVTLTLDWPQEFARKRAIFIGGTGYQYGDTDFVAYSEQIDANFAHDLRIGTGPVSIGQTLLQAKQDYLASQPNPGAIQQKAVLEATLYGLPMESLNLPDGRIPAPTTSSVVSSTTPASTDPGSTLGLSSADVTITPQLDENSVALNDLTQPAGSNSVTATYLSGSDGVVTNPYQPVLPLESKNVSVPGESVRGALFLGGHYTDTSGVTPLTGAPTTEIRGVHTGFSSSVLFPEKTWSINDYDALDGDSTGGTQLVVTPAQHVSDSDGESDTRRAFDSMSFRLFYSGNTHTYGDGASASTPALAAPPSISWVGSQPDPGDPSEVDVCSDLGGDPAAGIQDAYATWSDASKTSGDWQSQKLTLGGCDSNFDDPLGWGGTISLGDTDPSNLRFMVQAVNGTGLVSLDDNLGAFYSLPQAGDFSSSTIVHDVTVSTSSAPYGSTVSLSATLNHYQPPDFGPGQITDPIGDEPITFTIGTQSVTATTDTDTGVATATLPLDVPPGDVTPIASFAGTADLAPSSGESPSVTVSKQPTVIDLDPTAGSLPAGDSSFTATLCATDDSSCGSSDPPVANHNVIFVLSGPVNRSVSVPTDSSGQARYDAYGLPPGPYTLDVYFGAVPSVTHLQDPFYSDSHASAGFETSTADTTPPTLTVPSGVTATATNAQGAVVSYVAAATDSVDPRPAISCSPASDSLFPVGPTTVSCTATDTAGNSTTHTFGVTVQGQSAPPRQLSAKATSCNGTYTGTGKSVTVPAGGACTLLNSTQVTGSITVKAGGTLNAQGVTVGGGIFASGAGDVTVCQSAVQGRLSINNSAPGAVTTIGDPTNGCLSNSVTGDVRIGAIKGAVTVSGNGFGHNLTVTANSQSVNVINNSVGHDLTVTANTSNVVVTSNSVTFDLAVKANPGSVVVDSNIADDNLAVTGNKPGGATVTDNHATHKVTCSGNSPQSGKGNSGGGAVSCPK